MGRRQKQRKEVQKRQRNWRRGGGHSSLGAADGGEIQLLSYRVTPEGLDCVEPANAAFVNATSEDQRRELFDLIFDDPLSAVPRLKEFMEKYPGTPMLFNWIAAAYRKAGLLEEEDRVNDLNFRQNPEYLFARTAYAEACLHRKQPEKAAEAMDHKFDLKLLYPDRDLFHTTEFTAVCSVAILYYLQIGKRDQAEKLLKVMEKLAPDAESTEIMRQQIFASGLSFAARRFADLIRRGRRLPSDV
jgi:tetratricopeptide (TPR) repeat protein